MLKPVCARCRVQTNTLFFVLESDQPMTTGLLVCEDCYREKEEVVVEQKVAPSYAGVCASCMCAFDGYGRRTRVLSEEQFQQFKCRGMCATCAAVKAKVKRNKGGVS